MQTSIFAALPPPLAILAMELLWTSAADFQCAGNDFVRDDIRAKSKVAAEKAMHAALSLSDLATNPASRRTLDEALALVRALYEPCLIQDLTNADKAARAWLWTRPDLATPTA